MGEAAANVGGAREPMGPRKARRRRQEPPCFDGNEIASCFRPFFRRRESTARPQREAIRAPQPLADSLFAVAGATPDQLRDEIVGAWGAAPGTLFVNDRQEIVLAIMGGVFVVLWVVALRLGGRIDRERADRLTA